MAERLACPGRKALASQFQADFLPNQTQLAKLLDFRQDRGIN